MDGSVLDERYLRQSSHPQTGKSFACGGSGVSAPEFGKDSLVGTRYDGLGYESARRLLHGMWTARTPVLKVMSITYHDSLASNDG